jgi:hypothetical protein
MAKIGPRGWTGSLRRRGSLRSLEALKMPGLIER